MIFFFLPGLYCLADLFLYLRFRIRLTPSHLSFLLKPASFWSSSKGLIAPFALFAALLVLFPPLSLVVILFSKWPHPLLTAYREIKKKRLTASFPLSSAPLQGPKLFDLPTKDKPHILFISLESFRAKNVGCLGAKVPLSPHFDQLAENGILFTNFHATGNLTNRSIIATLFGIPPAHEPWHLGYYCNLPLIGIPHILSKQGYQTAVIQGGLASFDYGEEFFLKQGFQTVISKRDIEKPGTSWGVFDEHLMQEAASWLEKQKQPTFLNLYTITNHHPWIHPQKTNGYLNTFAYTDSALGILIEELRKKNLLSKCILFIYGDHGQELEDRTPHYEVNRHLTQDTLHVPLLIYAEGRIKTPQMIDTVASQIDLLPTLLDLMHLEEAHQSLGKSLLRPSSAPIFFSHPFDAPIRGSREGDWKYLAQKGKEELYHLGRDPEEKINRIHEGTPLKEKTEQFFTSLEHFYSEKPSEKKECSNQLSFKNCLKITDEKLEEEVKKEANLFSLSLANCLLLTEKGVGKALTHSPKLEMLYLEGLDEIKGSDWPVSPHLSHIKMLNCPSFKCNWIASLPSLQILQIDGSQLKDEDLLQLAQTQKNLHAIHFSNMDEITDLGLKQLLAVNPYLIFLSISGCPQITPSCLDSIQSKIIRYKSINEV